MQRFHSSDDPPARAALTAMKRAVALGALPAYVYALRRRARRAANLDELVDVALRYQWRSLSIAPIQVREELRGLIEKVEGLNCRTVLEIGTAHGGTLFLFSHVARRDAKVVSVDLPGGGFGGGYDRWQGMILRSFGRPGQQLRLVLGDSHSAGVQGRVRREFEDGPIDFLFIDGDHSYEGVRADFRDYSPLVRPGGMIAFHDIVEGLDENVGGVPRFWNEVRGNYPHEEIVKSRDQGGFGIGILHV